MLQRCLDLVKAVDPDAMVGKSLRIADSDSFVYES